MQYEVRVYHSQKKFEERHPVFIHEHFYDMSTALEFAKTFLDEGFPIVKVQSDDREEIEILTNNDYAV